MFTKHTEPSAENEHSPRQISDGIYGASCYTEEGEKIYFRMELLTADNALKWRQYAVMASRFGDVSSMLIDHGIIKNEATGCYVVDENTKKMTITPEMKELGDYLIQHGCVTAPKSEALNNIYVGAKSGNILREGVYVVYASKCAEFSMKNIIHTELQSKPTIFLKDFVRDYGNLLMSFGSDLNIDDAHAFHNRGIFKNPLAFVENSHKGLSMLLHGFSAVVAQIFFGKSELRINPVNSMRRILYHSLPRDAFLSISDGEYESTKLRGDKSLDQYNSGESKENIKTSVLVDFYFNTCAENEHNSALSLRY